MTNFHAQLIKFYAEFVNASIVQNVKLQLPEKQ